MRLNCSLRKAILSLLLLNVAMVIETSAIAQETHKVWATQYAAAHDFEVALPHVSLNSTLTG
jgi:hypothetical protein